MSRIGGGGFMTIQRANGERAVVDYFSRAPRAAEPAMHSLTDGVRADGVGFGGVKDQANAYGPLSIATPGMVAGLSIALERFGTRAPAETLAPAIGFAGDGLPIEWYQSLLIASHHRVIRSDPETARTSSWTDCCRRRRSTSRHRN